MLIVTISRLVGSYADIISATVARKLGLDLVSREQVHQMAQGCDPEYGRVCSLYEMEHGPGFFERIFLTGHLTQVYLNQLPMKRPARVM